MSTKKCATPFGTSFGALSFFGIPKSPTSDALRSSLTQNHAQLGEIAIFAILACCLFCLLAGAVHSDIHLLDVSLMVADSGWLTG